MQGPHTRSPIARAACPLAVQGQDQLAQAGQAGAVQQQEGGHHGRFRVQPMHQPQVGVPRRGVPAQEHGQGMTHAPRVAWIGELGQFIGPGAQGLPKLGGGACHNVFHEG